MTLEEDWATKTWHKPTFIRLNVWVSKQVSNISGIEGQYPWEQLELDQLLGYSVPIREIIVETSQQAKTGHKQSLVKPWLKIS